MLSRKQQWRRVKSRRRSGAADFSLYDDLLKALNSQEPSPSRITSEPQLHAHQGVHPQTIRAWKTANDLTDPRAAHAQHSLRLPPRKVHFTSTVKVILIPTREELNSNGLATEMWWNDSDYSEFKRAAISDLRGASRKHEECVEQTEVVLVEEIVCCENELPESPCSIAAPPSPASADTNSPPAKPPKHPQSPTHKNDMRDVSTYNTATKEDCKKMLQSLMNEYKATPCAPVHRCRPGQLDMNEELPKFLQTDLSPKHPHKHTQEDKVSQAVSP